MCYGLESNPSVAFELDEWDINALPRDAELLAGKLEEPMRKIRATDQKGNIINSAVNNLFSISICSGMVGQEGILPLGGL